MALQRPGAAARRWIAEGELGAINFVQSFFGSSPINLYRGRPEADRAAYGEGEAFFGPKPASYSDPRLARAAARARPS